MKPGKSTVASLTAHILRFGTSRSTDIARSHVDDVLDHVKEGRVLYARTSYEALRDAIVSSRELRRAARRLARMACTQEIIRLKMQEEIDTLRKRVFAFEKQVDALTRANATEDWDDNELPEDAAISAAFPTRSNRHDLYQEAMRMVGAKRSKHGLVKLVNWLLYRIAMLEEAKQ